MSEFEEGQRRQDKRIRTLERTVREISREDIENKKTLRRYLLRNFLAGIARGIGSVVGIALLGTVAVFLLTKLAENNMAGLGSFLAEIVKWVQRKL